MFILTAETSSLVDDAKNALSIIATTYKEWGLDMNFGPGKSEALLSFVGKSIRCARKQCFEGDGAHIVFNFAGNHVSVPIVASCKALGAYVSERSSMTAEAHHRANSCTKSAAQLRRPLFKALDMAVRL